MKKPRELTELYPWLKPTDYRGDAVTLNPNFPEYNELSFMPEGWQIAFGEKMAEELDQMLREHNFRDNYYVTIARSKQGMLNWEGARVPGEMYEKYKAWKDKYKELSAKTCTVCGKEGGFNKTDVWGVPLCSEHAVNKGKSRNG